MAVGRSVSSWWRSWWRLNPNATHCTFHHLSTVHRHVRLIQYAQPRWDRDTRGGADFGEQEGLESTAGPRHPARGPLIYGGKAGL